MPPFDLKALERAQRQHQQHLLAKAQSHARACGLRPVQTPSTVGPAAQEILRVAGECGADQIVMDTHGRGAIGSLLLGSVTQRVVYQANVPVLLVR